VPAESAVTKPDVGSIVATVVLVLLHVPPPVTLVNVVDAPLHILKVPVVVNTTGTVVTEIDLEVAVEPQVFDTE
jgi:hypothetical protein